MIENFFFEILQIGLLYLDDEDFWEPVKVGLPTEIMDTLKTVEDFNECPICTEVSETSKRLPCCKHVMCTGCTNRWFRDSVKCPFCIRDLRTRVDR